MEQSDYFHAPAILFPGDTKSIRVGIFLFGHQSILVSIICRFGNDYFQILHNVAICATEPVWILCE
jgi:hypothetical protein